MNRSTRSGDGALLIRDAAPPNAGSVILVLHGGYDRSQSSTHWFDPGVLRMLPIPGVIARRVPSAAVYRLRYAGRGWNNTGAGVLADTRWALAELRTAHPGLPIVLVGHSMGARVALHLGGEPAVAGVVLLAPWAPDTDPVRQLSGRTVVIVQGRRDRICPVDGTEAWIAAAERAGARVHRTVLDRTGHAMVRSLSRWNRLTWQGVRRVLEESLRSATIDHATASSAAPEPVDAPAQRLRHA